MNAKLSDCPLAVKGCVDIWPLTYKGKCLFLFFYDLDFLHHFYWLSVCTWQQGWFMLLVLYYSSCLLIWCVLCQSPMTSEHRWSINHLHLYWKKEKVIALSTFSLMASWVTEHRPQSKLQLLPKITGAEFLYDVFCSYKFRGLKTVEGDVLYLNLYKWKQICIHPYLQMLRQSSERKPT